MQLSRQFVDETVVMPFCSRRLQDDAAAFWRGREAVKAQIAEMLEQMLSSSRRNDRI